MPPCTNHADTSAARLALFTPPLLALRPFLRFGWSNSRHLVRRQDRHLILAREKTKTTAIARQLKRSVGALYQQASKLGVSLGAPRKKRKK